MKQPMLTPHDKWRTVTCDCVCQNGAWLVPCNGSKAMCDTPIGYLTGKKPPNYPMPATLHSADIAISWIHLCRHVGCTICTEQYMDSLEADFPDAFD